MPKRRKNFSQPGRNRGADSTLSSGDQIVTDRKQTAKEIPGFYYDHDKKRYFKIAPNHASGSCVYTKDSIDQRHAEEKRIEDVKIMFSDSNRTSVEPKNINSNIVYLLQKRAVNGCDKYRVSVQMLKTCVKGLKPLRSQEIFDYSHYSFLYNHVENCQIMHMNDSHDELLCMWSIKDVFAQRVQVLELIDGQRTSHCSGPYNFVVNANPVHRPLFIRRMKATDMCSVGKHVILYTAINNLFEGESIAFMRGLHDETKHLDQEYLLGSKVAWSCAWNPVRHQMAIGCEKSAQIINAERRTMFELNTNKCDPLALTFSQRGGCLYAGVRKGEVQVFDAQRGRPNPVYHLPHASGVVSVKPVHNDLHLLTGDFSGKIQLWDTRQRGVVVEYEGHVNKCTRLPIHIDETENIVYAVGEDGYTRFWDFREGRLLYTLPPPGPVTRETMPCVQLSTHWANQPGNCGLIMARENKLHYYGRLPATHLL